MNMNMKDAITIPKQVTGGAELVVIPRRVYEALIKHETEMKEVLAMVRRGEKEFESGKTRTAESLDELE